MKPDTIAAPNKSLDCLVTTSFLVHHVAGTNMAVTVITNTSSTPAASTGRSHLLGKPDLSTTACGREGDVCIWVVAKVQLYEPT